LIPHLLIQGFFGVLRKSSEEISFVFYVIFLDPSFTYSGVPRAITQGLKNIYIS